MLPRCFWQEVPLFAITMNCGSLLALQEISRAPLLLLEFSGVRHAALTWEVSNLRSVWLQLVYVSRTTYTAQ